ncbi:MAG: DNA-binding response regulator, partial [Magnetospirillum sp.]|nr:DNA-binding response regulator [Magnetospirillum sp.]
VTVKTHLGNAFRKLGVQNRVQAVRAWQRIGLK